MCLLRWNSYCSIQATGWKKQGLIPGRGKMFLYSPKFSERLWGTPSVLSNRYWRVFPSGKTAGAWSDFTLLSSAEVENEWSRSAYMPSLRGQRQLYLNSDETGMCHWWALAGVCYVTWERGTVVERDHQNTAALREPAKWSSINRPQTCLSVHTTQRH